MRGSVRPRGTGWVYIVDLPRINGKRRQETSRQHPSKREAEKALRERLGQLDRGQGTSLSKETVGQYVRTWIKGIKVRDSTRLTYLEHLKQRIEPHLGHILLVRLRPEQIVAWHAAMERAGMSGATANKAHGVLSQALKQAVAWGHITVNPAALVRQPQPRPPEMRVWSREEATRFLAATDGTPDAAFYRLALASGMRMGELLALRWEDVDWRRSRLAVRRTLSRSAQKGIGWQVEDTKTRASRSIVLDDDTLRALKMEQERQRFAGQGGAWVFAGRDGGFRSPSWAHARFKRAIEVAGVPEIRFHDMRHTMATLLLEAGVPLKMVSERLGHAKIAITADRYMHVSETMQADAAEAMRQALGGS